MPALLREATACRKGEGGRTGTNPTNGTAAVKAKGTGGSVFLPTVAAVKADGKTNDHCSIVLPAPATATTAPGSARICGDRGEQGSQPPCSCRGEPGDRGEGRAERPASSSSSFFCLRENRSLVSAASGEDISNTHQPEVLTNTSCPP